MIKARGGRQDLGEDRDSEDRESQGEVAFPSKY